MKLEAKEREEIGKKYAKKFRREGKIPAELYGHNEKNVHLLIDKKDLSELGEKGKVITLGIKGSPMVIIKDVQYNPITSEIYHIDFQYVHKEEKIKVKVPIRLEGEPVGVKQGGIIEHLLFDVEVESLPTDIPEEFKIDISKLEIGHAMHLKDLDIGSARLLENPEKTIVTVLPPKGAKEEKPAVVQGVAEEKKEEKKE